MADSNNAGAGLGLSDADYNAFFGSDGSGTSTGTTGGGGTDWLSGLASLANAGATAYRTANQPRTTPKNNSGLLLIGGAVALILVLVLALRK